MPRPPATMGSGASAAGAVRRSGPMGFDDLFNKSKKLFEDGKGKVTEFFDSDKGDGAVVDK